jgi:hypothetical protein
MIENKIINKGTGVGGANTILNGSSFEIKTSIENKLLKNNFTKIILNKNNKYGYYFEFDNIIYLTQSVFNLYFKSNKNNLLIFFHIYSFKKFVFGHLEF